MEALRARRESPQQTETDTQERDEQPAARAGKPMEPGWSVITQEGGASWAGGPEADATATRTLAAQEQTNEHDTNIDQGDGSGPLDFGIPNPMGAFAKPPGASKQRRIAGTPDGHLNPASHAGGDGNGATLAYDVRVQTHLDDAPHTEREGQSRRETDRTRNTTESNRPGTLLPCRPC